MDDDFEDLERELRRLRPRVPAVELGRRIERALAPTDSTPSRPRGWSAWMLLPAAAGIVLAFVAAGRLRPPGTGSASVDFRPVAAENLLLGERDEGYVTLADGTTARRVRQSYVDTITWKDQRTNASLVWRLPREEVRVVPVAFQ